MAANLDKFLSAQQNHYEQALREIKSGKKTTHWMWFIFPQIEGLGFSEMAQRYAIKNSAEADAYLKHPILGQRLIEISTALFANGTNNATEIMGSPDDLKLRSSLTLFSLQKNANPIFNQLIEKFFEGQKDPKTISRLALS